MTISVNKLKFNAKLLIFIFVFVLSVYSVSAVYHIQFIKGCKSKGCQVYGVPLCQYEGLPESDIVDSTGVTWDVYYHNAGPYYLNQILGSGGFYFGRRNFCENSDVEISRGIDLRKIDLVLVDADVRDCSVNLNDVMDVKISVPGQGDYSCSWTGECKGQFAEGDFQCVIHPEYKRENSVIKLKVHNPGLADEIRVQGIDFVKLAPDCKWRNENGNDLPDFSQNGYSCFVRDLVKGICIEGNCVEVEVNGYFETDEDWLKERKIEVELYREKFNMDDANEFPPVKKDFSIITPYDDLVCGAYVVLGQDDAKKDIYEEIVQGLQHLDFKVEDETTWEEIEKLGECNLVKDVKWNKEHGLPENSYVYLCNAKFSGEWTRQRQLSCEGGIDIFRNLDGSESYNNKEVSEAEVVVANYVFHFFPVQDILRIGAITVKDQVDFLIDNSEINKNTRYALKPIYYKIIFMAPPPEDYFPLRQIFNRAPKLKTEFNKEFDRIIFHERERANGGESHKDINFLVYISDGGADWVNNGWSFFILTHELGHTVFEGKFLADEYGSYYRYKKQTRGHEKKGEIVVNKYPDCSIYYPDSCEDKGGECMSLHDYFCEQNNEYLLNHFFIDQPGSYHNCERGKVCILPTAVVEELGNNCRPHGQTIWKTKTDLYKCSSSGMHEEVTYVYIDEKDGNSNSIGTPLKADASEDRIPGGRLNNNNNIMRSIMAASSAVVSGFNNNQFKYQTDYRDAQGNQIDICPLTKC